MIIPWRRKFEEGSRGEVPRGGGDIALTTIPVLPSKATFAMVLESINRDQSIDTSSQQVNAQAKAEK